MRKDLQWSSLAELDLNKIIDYLLTSWDAGVAEDFLNILEDCLQHIQDNPESYRMIDPIRKVRKCVVTKQNTIYYREVDNVIQIIRLFDTRQDPDKLNLQ
jgi:plasmid stabilization system protein ParE